VLVIQLLLFQQLSVLHVQQLHVFHVLLFQCFLLFTFNSTFSASALASASIRALSAASLAIRSSRSRCSRSNCSLRKRSNSACSASYFSRATRAVRNFSRVSNFAILLLVRILQKMNQLTFQVINSDFDICFICSVFKRKAS
jgi:hypothetical protein